LASGRTERTRRAERDFLRFRTGKKVDPIPSAYSVEFLLYQLSDGDGTKREKFLKEWTMEDALMWFYLSQYDAWAKAKQYETK
jgi:hypothetical protein